MFTLHFTPFGDACFSWLVRKLWSRTFVVLLLLFDFNTIFSFFFYFLFILLFCICLFCLFSVIKEKKLLSLLHWSKPIVRTYQWQEFLFFYIFFKIWILSLHDLFNLYFFFMLFVVFTKSDSVDHNVVFNSCAMEFYLNDYFTPMLPMFLWRKKITSKGLTIHWCNQMYFFFVLLNILLLQIFNAISKWIFFFM